MSQTWRGPGARAALVDKRSDASTAGNLSRMRRRTPTCLRVCAWPVRSRAPSVQVSSQGPLRSQGPVPAALLRSGEACHWLGLPLLDTLEPPSRRAATGPLRLPGLAPCHCLAEARGAEAGSSHPQGRGERPVETRGQASPMSGCSLGSSKGPPVLVVRPVPRPWRLQPLPSRPAAPCESQPAGCHWALPQPGPRGGMQLKWATRVPWRRCCRPQ